MKIILLNFGRKKDFRCSVFVGWSTENDLHWPRYKCTYYFNWNLPHQLTINNSNQHFPFPSKTIILITIFFAFSFFIFHFWFFFYLQFFVCNSKYLFLSECKYSFPTAVTAIMKLMKNERDPNKWKTKK